MKKQTGRGSFALYAFWGITLIVLISIVIKTLSEPTENALSSSPTPLEAEETQSQETEEPNQGIPTVPPIPEFSFPGAEGFGIGSGSEKSDVHDVPGREGLSGLHGLP